MSGSVAGGRKARDTNIAKHGPDFYRNLAYKAQEAWKKNGRKPRGFASDAVGEDGLTGRERASTAGRLGGMRSRRGKKVDTSR